MWGETSLLKGLIFAPRSPLIPTIGKIGLPFPCDGPGRRGRCQVSAWDHVFLGLFLLYKAISVVILHWSWKMQSDLSGSISDQGVLTHITGGKFAQSYLTLSSLNLRLRLRDLLWAQASQFSLMLLPAYGFFFLGAHFLWPFSLIFVFSGRGWWQELIESILSFLWAHKKWKVAHATASLESCTRTCSRSKPLPSGWNCHNL